MDYISSELYGDRDAAPILLVCEHASNFIPAEFENLGLADGLRESHIAWDPGAALVTRKMSDLLASPAVLGLYSRLLYDCNRPPEAHDAIPKISEIYDIPANATLSAKQKDARILAYYAPFRSMVTATLDRHADVQALVTIHSFTPVYKGEKRDVEIGILHDKDTRLADAMMASANEFTDLNVRRNEPYGPQHGVTHTLIEHGIKRGLLNVMLEVRNDLLQTQDQCFSIAEMLSKLVRSALGNCQQTTAEGTVRS